jgi:phospholipid/cholesterol/gamma-HCH transport system substrate-binding protein
VESNARQELRVGIFVVGLLFTIGAVTFLLSGGGDLLTDHYVLHTRYEDVKGMKVGAVVRLAGMDVGEVSRVEFAKDVGLKEIEVDLTIRKEFHERIRGDSVASIQQIGVLGDMYVGVTVGSAEQPALNDGATIQSAAAFDVLDYATQATDIVGNAASISKKVDLMLGSDDAARSAQIAKSLESVGLLLTEIKEGKGALHALIYDPYGAKKVRSILENLDRTTADVAAITGEVRQGDGLAHALIYDKKGAELTATIGEAARAVQGLVDDLKAEGSLTHALLYDPQRARMVDDLQATATSLREIAESVEQGDGTLGLLVKDPQLYEDVRALVGGAQRNALLRAYIRATVAKQKDATDAPFAAPEPEK